MDLAAALAVLVAVVVDDDVDDDAVAAFVVEGTAAAIAFVLADVTVVDVASVEFAAFAVPEQPAKRQKVRLPQEHCSTGKFCLEILVEKVLACSPA